MTHMSKIKVPRSLASRTSFRAEANLGELRALIEESNRAWGEFKAENEKRLSQLEKKGAEDPVTAEKLSKINASLTDAQKAIDEQNRMISRLTVGGGGGDVPDQAVLDHATAFNRFFRKGAEAGLRDLEVQAKLSTDSDPDGGYLVPEEMEGTIDRVLGTVSALRGLARVINISAPTYTKLVNKGGASSGWVGEHEGRTETNTPTLVPLKYEAMELYANPASTQTALDDARIDIASWLADEVAIEFAEQEGAAFITGNGVKKPRGILGYDTVANASYEWGKIGYIASGASGDFPAISGSATAKDADALIALQHALKQGYRGNARWLMGDGTLEAIRKLKDMDGNYIWRPGLSEAEPALLLGKPISTDDNMPEIAANSLSIAYGDFRRAYLIVDRAGIRVLRDPYTNKPYVNFYTTKRVGGGIQNFEAIKLLKFAAS